MAENRDFEKYVKDFSAPLFYTSFEGTICIITLLNTFRQSFHAVKLNSKSLNFCCAF